MTIEKLRKAGNKVRVNTFRYSIKHGKKLIPIISFRSFGFQNWINPKGGLVEVAVTTKEGKHYRASAHCSESDVFCKKNGINLAIERVVKEMDVK